MASKPRLGVLTLKSLNIKLSALYCTGPQVLDVARTLLVDMDGCGYWPHAQLDPVRLLNGECVVDSSMGLLGSCSPPLIGLNFGAHNEV